jgi:hypothetical protein
MTRTGTLIVGRVPLVVRPAARWRRTCCEAKVEAPT